MNTHILPGHVGALDACEEFAAFLSEVTAGDLQAPTPTGGAIADLIAEAMTELRTSTARLHPPEGTSEPTVIGREDLPTYLAPDGGGYDAYYRRHLRDLLAAVAATDATASGELVAALVGATARRTSELAAALGLDDSEVDRTWTARRGAGW